MPRRLLVTIVFASLTLAPAAVTAQTREVDIKAADGTLLKATYFSPGAAGPAAVLFHQCNSNRRSWNPLASSLVEAGFHVLTFNYRNVADAAEAPALPTRAAPPAPPPPPPPGPAAPRAAPPSTTQEGSDSDAVFAFLISQNGVDRGRIAAIGSSCGYGRPSGSRGAMAEFVPSFSSRVPLARMGLSTLRRRRRSPSSASARGRTRRRRPTSTP